MESAARSAVGTSAWFPRPDDRRLAVVAGPARLSRGFGADGLDHARLSKESGALARIFVCARTRVLACRSGVCLCVARARSLPALASVASVPGRSLSVALFTQTSLVFALWHRAARVGDHHSKLQAPCGNCDRSRRQHRDCFYPGSSGLGALWAGDEHDEHGAYATGGHSMREHHVALDYQP